MSELEYSSEEEIEENEDTRLCERCKKGTLVAHTCWCVNRHSYLPQNQTPEYMEILRTKHPGPGLRMHQESDWNENEHKEDEIITLELNYTDEHGKEALGYTPRGVLPREYDYWIEKKRCEEKKIELVENELAILRAQLEQTMFEIERTKYTL